MSNNQSVGSHAVVIGASIAGLLTARVLSDYFDQVTIIERDQLPQTPEYRKGVPQAHHTHVLMMRGQQSLERFFPGFETELDNAGVPKMRWLTDTQMLYGSGWLPQFDLGITTRNSTRLTLEHLVRTRLFALSNVRAIANCQVDKLLLDDTNTRVTGVQISYRRSAGDSFGNVETINADFVADASGRNSRTPEWLAELGYDAPQKTIVNPFVGYSSRLYKRLSAPVNWKLLGMNHKPPHNPRAGSCTLQENGLWIVTLMGFAHHYPPTDERGFLEYTQQLATSHLYEAIKDAEPASDIYGYRNTSNIMHHYEKLTRMPKRFIVIGDAVACFNPIYGQGMTVSAMAAETLQNNLARGYSLDDVGEKFQKQVAKMNSIPWLMATGADFQYRETEGERPSGIANLAVSYLDKLIGQMSHNPKVARGFIEVMNLVKPPTSLFHPSMILTVLKGGGNNTPASQFTPTAMKV